MTLSLLFLFVIKCWFLWMTYMIVKMNTLLYTKAIWIIKIDDYICFAWVNCIEGNYFFLLDVFKTIHEIGALRAVHCHSTCCMRWKKTIIFENNDWLINGLHVPKRIMPLVRDVLPTNTLHVPKKTMLFEKSVLPTFTLRG